MKILIIALLLSSNIVDLKAEALGINTQAAPINAEQTLSGESLYFPISHKEMDFSVNAYASENITLEVKLEKDENPTNANGFQWLIEGPANKNVTLLLTFPKASMKIDIKQAVLVRNHKGKQNIVQPENIKIYETDKSYVLEISNVNEFSSWALFSSTPTMTEWALILLGSLLAIAGGWMVWRRMA